MINNVPSAYEVPYLSLYVQTYIQNGKKHIAK